MAITGKISGLIGTRNIGAIIASRANAFVGFDKIITGKILLKIRELP